MASLKYGKTASLQTVTLGSSYTSASGTMSLTAGHGARLPSAGDFWLTYDDGAGTVRIFKVTARSTDTLTVAAEASEGSGDGNISSGATLRWSLTCGALDQLRADLVQTGAYASATAEKAGNLYLPTDSPMLLRDTGSTFATWGPIYKFTPPVNGDYSWVNQGTASVSTTDGGIYFLAPAASGNNLRMRVKSTPGTPWTFTVGFIPDFSISSNPFAGVCVRESGTGKIISYSLGEISGFLWTYSVINWTNETTFSSYTTQQSGAPPAIFGASMIWMRIEDNGTNIITSYSTDGTHYRTLSSTGRTAFMAGGPDQMGYVVNSGNASNTAGITILSTVIA